MEADTTNGTSNGAYGCFAQSDGEGTGRNVYPPYDTFWYARRGDMWGMYTITIECTADSEMLMFGSLTLNFPTYFRVIIGNGYNPPTSYPTTYTLASDNRTNYGFNRTTLTFIKGDGTTIVQYPGTNPWGGWTSNANNTITLPSGGIKKIIAYAPILWARIDATYLADIYYYPVTYDVTPLIISPMDVSLKVSKENEFRTLVKKDYITIPNI